MPNLCGWKNEKTGEQKISREGSVFVEKAFSGIHVISPEIFSLIKSSTLPQGPKDKFSMVDVYLELAKTHAITAFDHSNTRLIDVGKPESIEKAEKLFRVN
jgi:NDP-sugar pyrophosphorylase family protein